MNFEDVVPNTIWVLQLSSFHNDLRIQKERLRAWGKIWSDASALHPLNIDVLLNRAGIGDLVLSIMETINATLDEVRWSLSVLDKSRSRISQDQKGRARRMPTASLDP